MAAKSAILTFHSIDPSGSVISFEPERFRTCMESLAASGPPVVPLLECLRQPGTIALTFDDGFTNFAIDAWPVLRRLGLPATLFVVSDRVGSANGWDQLGAQVPELPLLDWPELRELAKDGVDLGAHSHTHADLTAISAEQLAQEFESPLHLIEERTGTKPAAFAYPFGKADARARAWAVGRYEAACGTEMGYWSGQEDMHETPRLDAYYLQGKVGPAEVLSGRGRRWMAARGWARRVRAGLSG